MKSKSFKFLVLILAAVLTLAAAGKKPAEKKTAKKQEAETVSGAAKAGEVIFSKNCALCHNADSTEEKMGSPGLKGFYKAEKLPHSGKPVTDKNVTGRIKKGSDKMPPFEKKLNKKELADLLAYLKTL